MTSWSKRINNVPIVVDSILKNTFKPDKIVLNLSLVEFPNKEADLPSMVLELEEKGVIEIGWQDANTKPFKKIIPTMLKYPNDAIISVDDDFIYPEDFIQTFVETHRKYPNNPLSGNKEIFVGLKAHCGCASLVKREYYGDFLLMLLSKEIIELGTDDIFYTFCANLNLTPYKYVGKEFFYNMQMLSQDDRLSTDDEGNRMHEMYWRLILKTIDILGVNIEKFEEPVFVH